MLQNSVAYEGNGGKADGRETVRFKCEFCRVPHSVLKSQCRSLSCTHFPPAEVTDCRPPATSEAGVAGPETPVPVSSLPGWRCGSQIVTSLKKSTYGIQVQQECGSLRWTWRTHTRVDSPEVNNSSATTSHRRLWRSVCSPNPKDLPGSAASRRCVCGFI